MNKTYSELKRLKTFKDRYEYLKLEGEVGFDTFGHDRYLNQMLYNLPEWRKLRYKIILRDNGCDLGLEGHEIYSKATIHHINPITPMQIIDRDPIIFDPENLITVSHKTHNALHYGKGLVDDGNPLVRTKNDTCPWKK